MIYKNECKKLSHNVKVILVKKYTFWPENNFYAGIESNLHFIKNENCKKCLNSKRMSKVKQCN